MKKYEFFKIIGIPLIDRKLWIYYKEKTEPINNGYTLLLIDLYRS